MVIIPAGRVSIVTIATRLCPVRCRHDKLQILLSFSTIRQRVLIVSLAITADAHFREMTRCETSQIACDATLREIWVRCLRAPFLIKLCLVVVVRLTA